MGMAHTEILHELPPPVLIDIALVVASAADDAVPVAAISMAVEVPISIDMSMLANGERSLEWSKIGGLVARNECRLQRRWDVNTGKNASKRGANKTHGQSGYYKQQDLTQPQDQTEQTAGGLEAPTIIHHCSPRSKLTSPAAPRLRPLADFQDRWGPTR